MVDQRSCHAGLRRVLPVLVFAGAERDAGAGRRAESPVDRRPRRLRVGRRLGALPPRRSPERRDESRGGLELDPWFCLAGVALGLGLLVWARARRPLEREVKRELVRTPS